MYGQSTCLVQIIPDFRWLRKWLSKGTQTLKKIMNKQLWILSLLLLFYFGIAFSQLPVITDTVNTWQGIPGLERTAKGRIYVSWFSGGEKEPAPENTVYLSFLDKKGKAFAAPVAIAGPLNGTRAFDPCLWIDPDGRLWYIFCRGNKAAGENTIHARICIRPDAKIPEWEEEFRIDFGVPFNFRLNKPTVLSTGEWLMPVTFFPERIYDMFHLHKTLQGVGISTDRGQTWKLHGTIESGPRALESMVVELHDGRLLMLINTATGFLWESYSCDRGKSWGESRPSEIESPASRFFIRKLASGHLLLVNHSQFKGRSRSHLTAMLSTDDGATWNEGLLLDERINVSYPDGVQEKNGLIWIVYDRARGGAGEILLARFREEDVMAGRDVSGDVRLKQVISRLDKTKSR
jgi:predicted neuraminidase